MADLHNPVKAIREKCLQCCAGQPLEVKECTVVGCAIYPFRMGKNPYRKPMSEERRRIMAERAKMNFNKEKTNE